MSEGVVGTYVYFRLRYPNVLLCLPNSLLEQDAHVMVRHNLDYENWVVSRSVRPVFVALHQGKHSSRL